MKKHSKHRRSSKAGLPPGSLVHIGDESAVTRIHGIRYNGRGGQRLPIPDADHLPVPGEEGILWLQVQGVNDARIIEKLGHRFRLHPLLLEDVMSTDQRPKIEDYGDHLFIVMRSLEWVRGSGVIQKQIALVLGKGYVISFEEGDSELSFTSVVGRILDHRGRVCEQEADYLAYSLIDSVVDHYFAVLESVSDEIEALEEEVLTGKEGLLSKIHYLKRELIVLRKSIWPLREALVFMERQHSTLISSELTLFFRDIYDHTIHIVDTIESFRDMLSGLLDVHLSSISTRLNQVMKVLTVITTIFMPLTLLTGLYGMNFHYMPELQSPWGYPAVLCAMVLITGGMVWFFKRIGWL